MDLRLGVHQSAHRGALRLLQLAHQAVDADVALPLLRRDLIVALQAVQEPAVAVRLLLVLRRQCLEILLQLPEALLQGIEAVPDHLQRGRRGQLLQDALHLPVGIPDGLQVMQVHLHLVVAQDPHGPAVFVCQLHAQILQDMVHAGKGLVDAVAQVAPGSCHQLLVAGLCLLIGGLHRLAFVIDSLQGSRALSLGEHAQHVRGEPGQLARHIAGLLVVLVLLHSHVVPGEILVGQLVLRPLQGLNQLHHGLRVDGEAAAQQPDVHLRGHPQAHLLQLPPGGDVPHRGLPELAAVVEFGDGRRPLVQVPAALPEGGMDGILALRHRGGGRFRELLLRHGQLNPLQRLQPF